MAPLMVLFMECLVLCSIWNNIEHAHILKPVQATTPSAQKNVLRPNQSISNHSDMGQTMWFLFVAAQAGAGQTRIINQTHSCSWMNKEERIFNIFLL